MYFSNAMSAAPRKICFVITSKIHYSRNKRVLEALRSHPNLKLQIVVGGSALLERFGLVEPEMEKDGFHADARCFIMLDGGTPATMAKSAGIALMEMATIFEQLAPDVVVVRGDRSEVLSVAMAAAYMNITVAHIEGGDITGSIDESVRHAITKLAHIHFPTNETSAARIVRMGELPEQVFTVGSPELEVVAEGGTLPSEELINYLGVGDAINLDAPFVMVMQHPVTSETEDAQVQITETLHAVRELNTPALWFWPNADAGSDAVSKGIRTFREQGGAEHIRFLKYLPADQFYGLLSRAACLVGNSSAGFKEAAFLGTPVVNIGSRQQRRYDDHPYAHMMHVSHSREAIASAITAQLTHGPYPADRFLYREGTGRTIAGTLATIKLFTQKTFQDRTAEA